MTTPMTTGRTPDPAAATRDSSFLLTNTNASNEDFDETTINVQTTTLNPDLDFGGLCGVVVAENDVANGFVKDGSSLPYIFESNESGRIIFSLCPCLSLSLSVSLSLPFHLFLFLLSCFSVSLYNIFGHFSMRFSLMKY